MSLAIGAVNVDSDCGQRRCTILVDLLPVPENVVDVAAVELPTEAGRLRARDDVRADLHSGDARISDTRNVVSVIQAGAVLDRAALQYDPAKDLGFKAIASITSGTP